jgi:hypothetical protein
MLLHQQREKLMRFEIKAIGILIAVGSLGCFTATRAAIIEPSQTYSVSLDTSSLESDMADQPFGLTFVFDSGGVAGDANTASFGGFNFDTGSAGAAGSILSSGDISPGSSLASAVTLDTDDGVSSSFEQNFVPGATLTFLLTVSEYLINLTGDPPFTPDTLDIGLYDPSGPVPTTSADGVSALALSFGYEFPGNVTPPNAAATIITSSGVITTPSDAKVDFPAPVVTVVPEPSTLILLVIPAAALRRRRVPGR